MEPAEIGNRGERYATGELQSKGFTCYRNTQLPGSTDIEARSGGKGVIVQVKTAMYPFYPNSLSTDERSRIVGRANRNGWEAWLAQVQIDGRGALIGSVHWTKLN